MCASPCAWTSGIEGIAVAQREQTRSTKGRFVYRKYARGERESLRAHFGSSFMSAAPSTKSGSRAGWLCGAAAGAQEAVTTIAVKSKGRKRNHDGLAPRTAQAGRRVGAGAPTTRSCAP